MDFDGMTPGTCGNLLCWGGENRAQSWCQGSTGLGRNRQDRRFRPNGVQEERDEVPQDLKGGCLEIKDVCSRD